MTSRAYSFKRADEIGVGEVICGTEFGGEWGRTYTIVAPLVGGIAIVENPNGERCNWYPDNETMIMIEERMFKYDPNQQGDTEDDI